MRYIIILFLSFLSVVLKSQTPQTSYVVASITSMKNYYGQANRIHVSATGRDYVQCSPCTIDEATVFAGANGRKWKLISTTKGVFDIMDFGADPLGLADSRAAIQGAIDACPVGGKVIVPAGTFVTSDSLILKNSVTLQGLGTSKAIVSIINPMASFPVGHPLIAIINNYQVVKGIATDMNYKGGSWIKVNGDVGLHTISDCNVQHVASGYWGIHGNDSLGTNGICCTHIERNFFHDFGSVSGGIYGGGGVWLNGAGDSFFILDNIFQLVNSDSYVFLCNNRSGAIKVVFNGNNATGAAKGIVRINYGHEFEISGNQFEQIVPMTSTPKAMIRIDGQAVGGKIADNNINGHDIADVGIYADFAENLEVNNITAFHIPYVIQTTSRSRGVMYRRAYSPLTDVLDTFKKVTIIYYDTAVHRGHSFMSHIINRVDSVGGQILEGLRFENTTNGTDIRTQFSPSIHFKSQGFDTITGLSQYTNWWAYNQPINGSPATSDLVFRSGPGPNLTPNATPFTMKSDGGVVIDGRVRLSGGAVNGDLLLTNTTKTGFGKLQFVDTSANSPALRANGASLQAILADGSGYTDLALKDIIINGIAYIGQYIAPTAGATLNLYHRQDLVNGLILNNIGNTTMTSGDRAAVQVNENFWPTSGTATLSTLRVRPSIDQTGGASGITIGAQVAPILATVSDWRSIQWENNTHWGLFGRGTAHNYMGGRLLLGDSLDNNTDQLQVKGSASVGASAQFKVNSTGNIVTLNGVTTSFPSSNSAGVLTNNGSGTLTWASGGAVTASSVTVAGSAIGTTFVEGFKATNSTAAALGAVQNSHGITLQGATWNTTSSTSRTATWRQYVKPVQSTVDYSQYTFGVSYAGGAYTDVAYIDPVAGYQSTIGFGNPSKFLIAGGTNNGDIRLTNTGGSSFGLLQFGGTTASFPALKRTTTALNVRLADDSGDGDLTAAKITSSGLVVLKGYTVSTLPAGIVGATAYVTDATAPTYNGALTGGGSVVVTVFYNGSSWVSQ